MAGRNTNQGAAQTDSVFADAREKIENGLAAHYASGDYVPLGMAIQDVVTEVLLALRLAEAQEAVTQHGR